MIREFETEEEMDSEFNRIEELNHQHYDLQQAVEMASEELEEAQAALKEAMEELDAFEKEHKSYLIG